MLALSPRLPVGKVGVGTRKKGPSVGPVSHQCWKGRPARWAPGPAVLLGDPVLPAARGEGKARDNFVYESYQWLADNSLSSLIHLAMLCGMWELSSPTRDQTLAPCSGSLESEPPDHQRIPCLTILKNKISYLRMYWLNSQKLPIGLNLFLLWVVVVAQSLMSDSF